LKILILKPSSLGDVVLALPVLRLLRRRFPDSEIFWWIDTSFAPLLENDPDLTGIIPFKRREWQSPRRWLEPVRSVQAVRAQKFDWVIDLQALARSAIFGWLANAGLFIGPDDGRDWANGFYDVIVPRPAGKQHAADWYLEVLRTLDVPVDVPFEWMPSRPAVAQEARKKWPVDNHRWIALQPGARWVNKRWPAEHFAEFVRLFLARLPEYHFAIMGSKDDHSLGQIISAAAPNRCLDLTGQTSLPEMVEWIRMCDLIVTNDTGPMHIGAALQKPLVALLGPTNPLRTGPYHRPQDVLQLDLPCVPCMSSTCTYVKHMECLRGINPESVFQAVQDRLLNRAAIPA
jgi:lipopolysaccharide heptosyltransferase II